MSRAARVWLALAWIAYAFLPWHLVESLSGYPFGQAGSGLALGLTGQAWWLVPMLLPLFAATRPLFGAHDSESTGRWLAAAGAAGLALIPIQGFAVGLNGWNAAWLASFLGVPGPRQG